MNRLLPALAAVLLASPGMAQVAPSPALTLEQAMLLRCSAAFAVVADEQRRGVAEAQAFPPLGERGREYFVRSAARLMDELGLTSEQVGGMIRAEVERLQQGSIEADDSAEFVDGVMQPCLAALEASGL